MEKEMEKENAIKIINSLANELSICLHWRNEFKILFPNEDLQYELYKETASNFFANLVDMFYDYFILKISKLLDPAVVRGFENLSLYQLEKIADEYIPEEKEKIRREIAKINDDAEIIRFARKKLKAHKDLEIALNNTNIGETYFSEIESLIDRMAFIINYTLVKIGENEISFMWFRDIFGATALINSLKNSSYYRDLSFDLEFYDKLNQIEKNNKYYNL